MSFSRRLAKDHGALRASPPPNYLFPHPEDTALATFPDDLTHLLIYLTGPTGTPFARGLFLLHLRMPTTYPSHPPTATFRTKIFHPNVDPTSGAVCLETLKRDWDPKLTLKDILVTIGCLLIQPNPDSALNEKAGVLVREDYSGFEKQAKLMTKIHASIPPHLQDEVEAARRRGDEDANGSNKHSVTTSNPRRVRTNTHTSEVSKENTPAESRKPAGLEKKAVLGKRSLVELAPSAETTQNGDTSLSTGLPPSCRKSPKHAYGDSAHSNAKFQSGNDDGGGNSKTTNDGGNTILSLSNIRSEISQPLPEPIAKAGPPRLRTHARIGIRRL